MDVLEGRRRPSFVAFCTIHIDIWHNAVITFKGREDGQVGNRGESNKDQFRLEGVINVRGMIPKVVKRAVNVVGAWKSYALNSRPRRELPSSISLRTPSANSLSHRLHNLAGFPIHH